MTAAEFDPEQLVFITTDQRKKAGLPEALPRGDTSQFDPDKAVKISLKDLGSGATKAREMFRSRHAKLER